MCALHFQATPDNHSFGYLSSVEAVEEFWYSMKGITTFVKFCAINFVLNVIEYSAVNYVTAGKLRAFISQNCIRL